MSDSQETLYTIALTKISHFNAATCLQLYRKFGSATAIMENRNNLRDVAEDVSPKLIEALSDVSNAMRLAEKEMEFDNDHNIRPLTIADNDYPNRMRDCEDAPIVMFYRGTADLNNRRIVSIVGTRKCTIYGQDIIRNFCKSLSLLCPQCIIVSGLAYGVDINAHRNALENGMDTIGVLAHGLDYLYPTAHLETAAKMLSHGGLLTEFLTHTNADKINFVRRNRIVAGISDATIVVESASHGGGLITAGIAQSYGRDVFAFPGNVAQPYSEGCNNLIRDNKAALITNAEDFINAMGWEDDTKRQSALEKGIERQLFPELTEEETRIVNLLKKNNDLQLNIIAIQTGMPIHMVSAHLFSLEMKGVVKLYAGGMYHLLA